MNEKNLHTGGQFPLKRVFNLDPVAPCTQEMLYRCVYYKRFTYIFKIAINMKRNYKRLQAVCWQVGGL